MEVSGRLSGPIGKTQFTQLPPEVSEYSKSLILSALGAMVAGANNAKIPLENRFTPLSPVGDCVAIRKKSCHSRANRNPGFPVKTGIQCLKWFPAFAGTTPGCQLSLA